MMNSTSSFAGGKRAAITDSPIPTTLFDLGVYKEKDFRNEHGVRPPFWSSQQPHQDDNNENNHIKGSSLSKGAFNSIAPSTSWGPCYPPPNHHRHHGKQYHSRGNNNKNSNENQDYWQNAVAYAAAHNKNNHSQQAEYNKYSTSPMTTDVAGFCRPGFLIIGAGKCGTRCV